MAIGDQYWGKVVLACHFNARLIDNSPYARILTLFGNVLTTPSQSKFGAASAYFDGSGDYIVVNNADFLFGTGDFTIDLFFRPDSVSAYASIFSTGPYEGNQLSVRVSDTGKLQTFIHNGVNAYGVQTGAATLVAGAWHHIAVVGLGGTINVYLNGALQSSAVNNTPIASTGPAYIGTQMVSGVAGLFLKGHLEDFRVTKGVARYTAAFTPPASAFLDYAVQIVGTVKDPNGSFARRLVRAHRRADGKVSDEKLSDPTTGVFALNCNDTTTHYAVVHDSDAWITYLPLNGANNATAFDEWSGKTVTSFGNAKISTAQSVFGGASAYFDGAGDYLSLPGSADLEFGADPFTLEFRLRPATIGTTQSIYVGWPVAGPNGIVIQITAAGKVRFTAGDADVATWNIDLTGATTLSANIWYHVACVRNGATFTVYLNGVSDGTASGFSGAIAALNGKPVYIGSNGADTFLNGYLDDFVISKGVARHTANFTPPATPFGDSLNTANAMVYDMLTPA